MPKLDLEIPLVNGCGTGSYLGIAYELEKMGIKLGAFVMKSGGPCSEIANVREEYRWEKEKKGNPNPTVVYTGSILLNSMALPTHPIESWVRELKNSELKMPIIGSVWGNKPEDYALLIEMLDPYVDAHQMNVSCPNKEAGEKSVMEFMTAQILAAVELAREATKKPLMVKLSPNENYVAIAELVKHHADHFVCGNTVGPGLVIDIYSRRPVLAGNYGGMSGPAMKPKIMKMVNDVYEVVKGTDVGIVASGGISRWEDIIEYSIAGASMFEVGTCAFIDLKGGTARGRKTEEIVKFTNDLWNGVQKFLKEENTTLDKLVGSMVKNG
ncbi:hypothetical protein GOV06_03805 [Candidatus Woesearchaeota archaeon]|nr:hypothetical protein [Candidatus Woesearchaeota archaeon]